MAPTASRNPSWLTPLVISFFFVVQYPLACLAQGSMSAFSFPDPTVTAGARSPDPGLITTSQPSSTSSAAAQTHMIQVGLADHKFRPDITEAKVGDTLEFRFYPANHSVVRAEYGFPCIPYEMTGTDKQGFFTGFHPVDQVLDDAPKYTILVNDTNPMFFYCSAPGSCLHYGMVGAVNPNSSTSIDTQRQLALDSSYMLNPGQPFPAESPLPSNLPSATAPAGSTETNNKGKHGLSAGAIAGIVIAGIAVIVLAALLFFFWGRTKSLKDEVDRKAGTVRRISPSSSSTGMLETRRPRHEAGSGLGIYQHYTNTPPAQQQQQQFGTPAPAYYSPVPQHQQYQKHDITSPIGHPAYSPPPVFAAPQDTTTPASMHRALSHRSVGGTFELSPTGEYARTQDDAIYPHRSLSPQYPETKFSRHGGNEQVPSYYDTVLTADGKTLHVNQQLEPAEMEGTPAATPAPAPRWEEVEGQWKTL